MRHARWRSQCRRNLLGARRTRRVTSRCQIPGVISGQFVALQLTAPASPMSTCIASSGDNDIWPKALDFGPFPTMQRLHRRSRQGALVQVQHYPGPESPGHADRPAGRLRHRRLQGHRQGVRQARSTPTTTTTLNKLNAEFAPSTFSPSTFSPSTFSPSTFSPDAYAPSTFSPSTFSPSHVQSVDVLAVDVQPLDVQPVDVQPIDVLAVDVQPVDVLEPCSTFSPSLVIILQRARRVQQGILERADAKHHRRLGDAGHRATSRERQHLERHRRLLRAGGRTQRRVFDDRKVRAERSPRARRRCTAWRHCPRSRRAIAARPADVNSRSSSRIHRRSRSRTSVPGGEHCSPSSRRSRPATEIEGAIVDVSSTTV